MVMLRLTNEFDAELRQQRVVITKTNAHLNNNNFKIRI